MTDEELVERCFLALMNDRKLGMPLSAHFERHILKQRIAAIIPIVRAEQRERDAAIAEEEAQSCELFIRGMGTNSSIEKGRKMAAELIATAIRKGAE